MFTWLAENLATVIISVVLIAVVALIVLSMVKKRKQGKPSCGCGCAHCAMHGACHSKTAK